MKNIDTTVRFFVDLARIQAIMNRRFDNGLGGLGFNEFIILIHLSQAENERMRRIDLAEKIGLTASGVTRILLPMEKIGLVSKEVDRYDARSSLVMIAPGGRRKLEEAMERAESLVNEIIPADKRKKTKELVEMLSDLCGFVK
ncbi:MAG: winged helix-turn-helix transcriptional regulator [Candidatus Moranbacteria bacterium]|nr:winged helix-turn-helix transcriptional regulator [Candidatus Moranbacteria bacterium]